jgi:GT2 family glycosyltransferase
MNGRDHLETCLASLERLEYPRNNLQVVVVDNASRDDSVDFVKKSFPWVQVQSNETNLGFAPALNQACRDVQSDYLAFLNNDTRVEPDWLSRLVDVLESSAGRRESIAAACGAILDWDGLGVQFFGGYINLNGKAFHDTFSPEDLGSALAVQPTLYACGAGMVIRTQVFLESGGFDDDYFMIYEDVDLGWRLNILGFRSALVRDARMYHHESASLKSLDYTRKALWWERNALWTIYKNFSDSYLESIWPAALAMAFKREHILLEAGRKEEFKAHHEGVVAALQGLPGMKTRRRWIQSARKVPDAQLMEFFPRPYRMWAYAQPHYEIFAEGGYHRFIEDCVERFNLRRLFDSTTSAPPEH